MNMEGKKETREVPAPGVCGKEERGTERERYSLYVQQSIDVSVDV